MESSVPPLATPVLAPARPLVDARSRVRAGVRPRWWPGALARILRRLWLRWFVARRTLGYTADYVERLYQIYLNHSKVIHVRDGCPVYSLTTPALFSKPSANFFARTLYRSIQNKNLPNMMSYAVNDVCNAHCEHCSFFTAVEDRTRRVLSLEEARKLIHDAQELGVSVINLVGGEPLLREDLPEIIRAVDKDLSTTVLFTNGWYLEDRIADLQRAGLDSVYVSIDAADPAVHDSFRGRPGLFVRAVAGIRRAKKLGLSTGISCCLTPEAFRRGELDALVELGRQIGVHEVLVFDALPTGRYKFRKDLIDNPEWVEELIAEIKKYNEDARYPGVLAFAYATSHRSVGCGCGTSYFYLSPYGDLMSCDFNHAIFGNVLERPLYQLWDALTSQADFQRAKWGGCKIKSSASRAQPTVSAGGGCAGCG